MVTLAVWISTTTPHISADVAHSPDHHWQLVGTIDTAQETEFGKHIKVMLNLLSTSPRTNLRITPSSGLLFRLSSRSGVPRRSLNLENCRSITAPTVLFAAQSLVDFR
jgi:hypothetical protein